MKTDVTERSWLDLGPATVKKSELKVLELAGIHIGTTNPRKTFDEKKLQELSQSIREHGVLQPILVRPKGPTHQLVCGERRYRASIIAGLDSIPCNIRELTDDEAFELQIVENLERADVHPLDEADAYKKMIDSGRYTIADVAAKMAKPESFIAQRLKLNDLIPDIQADFFNNECTIGQAIVIARLDIDQQKDIFKSYKNRHGGTYGTLRNLQQEVDNKSYDLSTAIFSHDIDYACGAACKRCMKRSSNSPLLFTDMDKDSCFNKACFNSKTEEFVEMELRAILESGNEIFIGRDWNYEPSESVKQIAAEYSVPILKSYNDFDSNPGKHQKTKSLFFVSGSNAGKIVEVHIYTKHLDKLAEGGTQVDQIKKAKERAVRFLELDQEKIHTAIIEGLRKEIESEQARHFTLGDDFVFIMALYWAIETLGSYYVASVAKKLGIDYDHSAKTFEELEAAIANISKKDRIRLMVYVTFNKSKGSTIAKGILGQLIRYLADNTPKVNVQEIEAKQKAAADKRIAKSDARIAELEAELAAAKPKKGRKQPNVVEKSTNQ